MKTGRDTMLWLEGEEVILHDDAQALPIFIDLRNRDKRGEKQWFKIWLKYLYHAYKKDHAVYKNALPSERKLAVIQMLGVDKTLIKEWDLMLKEHIALYTDSQYTPVENMIRKLVADMDEYIIRLQTTKWTKDIVKTRTVDGTTITENFEDIDVERKTKYLKAASDLITLNEHYKKMLVKEYKDTERENLFETR
jgi:hypothetical protein